jgi:hypothetical protein
MIVVAALGIVIAAGSFLLALGLACLFRPGLATAFLMGFASTPAKHWAELVVRLVVGAAFVGAAPGMALATPFAAFGWLLVLTTVALALVPWQLHRAFAARAVPLATAHPVALGMASSLAGAAVLAAAATGAT